MESVKGVMDTMRATIKSLQDQLAKTNKITLENTPPAGDAPVFQQNKLQAAGDPTKQDSLTDPHFFHPQTDSFPSRPIFPLSALHPNLPISPECMHNGAGQYVQAPSFGAGSPIAQSREALDAMFSRKRQRDDERHDRNVQRQFDEMEMKLLLAGSTQWR
jgi:hypothetical protein